MGCRLAVYWLAGHVGHISAIDFALRARQLCGQQVAQGVVGRPDRVPPYAKSHKMHTAAYSLGRD